MSVHVASRPPELTLPGRRPSIGTWVTAIRPRQWVKNILVAVPAAAAADGSVGTIARAILAFVVLTAVAGGTYLINDVLDAAADRIHPVKRHRPVAAGKITKRAALGAGVSLLVAGPIVAGLTLSTGVAVLVGLYAGLTVAFSVRLKRIALLDVVVLAAGFALRVHIGDFAPGIGPSPQ